MLFQTGLRQATEELIHFESGANDSVVYVNEIHRECVRRNYFSNNILRYPYVINSRRSIIAKDVKVCKGLTDKSLVASMTSIMVWNCKNSIIEYCQRDCPAECCN